VNRMEITDKKRAGGVPALSSQRGMKLNTPNQLNQNYLHVLTVVPVKFLPVVHNVEVET